MHDFEFDAPRPFSKWKVALVALAAAAAIYLAAFKLKSNPAEAKINRFVEIMKQEDAKGLAAEITETELKGYGISRETAEIFIRDYFFANMDVVSYDLSREAEPPGTILANFRIERKSGSLDSFEWLYSPLSVTGWKKEEADDFRFTMIFDKAAELMYGDKYTLGTELKNTRIYRDFFKSETANLKRIGLHRIWEGGSRTRDLEDCLKLHERALEQAAKKQWVVPAAPGSPQP